MELTLRAGRQMKHRPKYVSRSAEFLNFAKYATYTPRFHWVTEKQLITNDTTISIVFNLQGC